MRLNEEASNATVWKGILTNNQDELSSLINDFTIYALTDGTFAFRKGRKDRTFVDIVSQ